MSDLTERLAAKLRGAHWSPTGAADIAILAPTLLPLLLSEPELVASLPDAVRRSVLSKRELAVMKLGEAAIVKNVKLDAFVAPQADENGPECEEWLAACNDYAAALAEARALAPSPGATPAPPLEGTNDGR